MRGMTVENLKSGTTFWQWCTKKNKRAFHPSYPNQLTHLTHPTQTQRAFVVSRSPFPVPPLPLTRSTLLLSLTSTYFFVYMEEVESEGRREGKASTMTCAEYNNCDKETSTHFFFFPFSFRFSHPPIHPSLLLFLLSSAS